MRVAMIKVYLGLVVLLLAPSVFAASPQDFTVRDGDAIKVIVSGNQLNRLAFSGSTRIERYWGANGLIEADADKANGELFFKPTARAGSEFSFFIRDSHGSTYTIIATKKDAPVQTIMLKPKAVTVSRADLARFKSNDHETNISALVRAMDQGKELSGYEVFDMDEEVPVWKETDIKLVKQYEGHYLTGDVYLVRNKTDVSMSFAESEFFGFGDAVRATSIRSATLNPGEMTLVYVVREGGE